MIKERPGEPRFGLDVPQATPQAVIHTWNDLVWSDVLDNYDPDQPSPFLRVGERAVSLTNPGGSGGAEAQYNEDSSFHWQTDTHAGELAYILFQVPVLMAVHASEMLKNLE